MWNQSGKVKALTRELKLYECEYSLTTTYWSWSWRQVAHPAPEFALTWKCFYINPCWKTHLPPSTWSAVIPGSTKEVLPSTVEEKLGRQEKKDKTLDHVTSRPSWLKDGLDKKSPLYVAAKYKKVNSDIRKWMKETKKKLDLEEIVKYLSGGSDN